MTDKIKKSAKCTAVISTLLTIGIIANSRFISETHHAATAATTEKSLSIRGEVAEIYTSIDGMGRNSDLIVVGTFEGNPTFRPEVTGPEYPPREDPEALVPTERDLSLVANNAPPYREMTFQVSDVLKGENLLGGAVANLNTSSIVVKQVAISENGEEIGVTGDRLFQANEEYILFLSADSNNGQSYFVTGVTQGAFSIKDGVVSSINNIDGVFKLGPVVQDQPLTSFLATVRSAIGL